MNKIFKVIYSKTRHCYVVVSELAKSHCKTTGSHTARNKTALTAAVLLALGAFSFAGMPVAQADADAHNNDFIGANDYYWYWDAKANKWAQNTYRDLLGHRQRKDLPNNEGAGAKETGSVAAGLYAQAGMQTVTIGNRNAGQSRGSVFIGEHSGYDDKASNVPKGSGNNYVTSVGFQSDATGWGSIAIGSNATAENTKKTDSAVTMTEDKTNNIYEIEKKPTIEGASVALGYGAHSKDGNIAIGAYSEATTDLSADTSEKAKSYLTGKNATSYVSVGSSDVQRRISNVADGAAASDVATVRQLQALSDKVGVYDAGFGIKITPNTNNKTNTISLDRNLGRDADTKDKAVLKADEDKSALVVGGRVNPGDTKGGQTTEKDYGALGQDSVTVGGADNTASGDAAVVVGGLSNTASAQYSTVVGGSANDAVGNESAVFGGHDNDAYGTYATLSGGSMNRAYGEAASVFGGGANSALGASSVAVGGLNSTVNGTFAVGIAGGSTNADYALAAGNGANVTVKNGTAIGYQATANKEGTIAFGHDKDDVSAYTVTWEKRTDGQTNADGTDYDYTKPIVKADESKNYKDAYYNRLVKVADGIDDHDVVVMEQLKQYAEKDASNIGNNIKVYKTDENGNVQLDKDKKPIEDKDATTTAQKANKDAWGKALGADSFIAGTATTVTDASTSDQLVTGKTLYDYDKPTGSQNYVNVNNTTGQNLSALDAQVKANADTLNDKTHNIKYYSVNDENKLSFSNKTLPTVTGLSSNEDNTGAKGMGSLASGFSTEADGVLSTVSGSYSGVINEGSVPYWGVYDVRGTAAVSYGTGNINKNTAQSGQTSGAANSTIGQVNDVTDSNAAIAIGAGNSISNSYRDVTIDPLKIWTSRHDPEALRQLMKDAVKESGGQVLVMGGGNEVDSAYMSQVIGVGNTVKGNQVYTKDAKTGEWNWTTDTNEKTAIKDYNAEKSSQYNYVDGFSNEVINGKHDYIIGANNKLSGDSYDDDKVLPIKRSNKSNIVIGDNHTLTREQNTVIIGSSDTENTQTKARDAVIIGHNANATNDTGADNAVAIGLSAKAKGGNAVTIGVNTSAGENSITIGSESSTISGSNIAIGRYAQVYGYNVTNAVALGENTKALVADGVAIGSKSQATVAGNSVEGYNPVTGEASTDETATWKATKAAVSIGKADGTVTRQINGLAAGTNDTDAVNVAQLKKLEGMKANIDASNIGANLKGADGKTASTEKITANENAWGTALGTGKVADPKATGETSAEKNGSQQLVTGGTVFNETRISAKDEKGQDKTYNYLNANNSAGKNLEALDSALKTVSTTAGAHTVLTVEGNTSAGTGKDAKTNEDVYAGKNILLHESTDETTGKVTYDLKLSKDINIGKPGKDGEDGKIGIDGKDGHIGLNGSDGITVRGLDGKDDAPGKDGVTITGPKGEAGKDGIDGKVGISGKDGNDAVSISGKDGVGHIGLTGPAGTNGKDGASIDITVKNGYDDKDKGINGTNGVDGKDGITRIVYTDKTGEHQVATMEDGLKFKGDDDTVINKKLNNTMEIIGGAKGDLTENNIGVNSTKDGKLKVQLSKDLTGMNSTTYTTTTGEGDSATTSTTVVNGNGLTITNGPSITNKGVDGGNKVITNVGSGIEVDGNGKYTVTDQNKGNAANIGDVQNMVNDAKKNLTEGTNGLNNKANIDASNIGANLKGADGKTGATEAEKTKNENAWGKAIGTGKIEKGNGQLVTGDTVYNEVRPKKDGNYVKTNQTTGENLSALDSKIGKLDKDGNYIKKDDSISQNLNTLDTQVKKNADDITNINKSISTLDQNAVKYDDSSKSKITLGGEGGTTITNVKDGTLSDSSTEAVNGKQLYNEQQAREAADKAITEKVTNNTSEITKIKNGDFTDASKTAIHNIAKDAVEVVGGVNTTVTKVEGTNTTPTTYAVNVEGTGKVASGDTGLISGGTLYKEVHVDKDGSYIKGSNTVGQNLSALDTGLKTTSDLIHTNDKGDTIQIGGNSTATKLDVNGKDGKGRVITGVVSDANDPNSAANVGYVNGLTAANTQQIYRDMNNAYSRLDTNINRAAAGSNALAALHPLDFDPDDKASFAVGYGHYHNANAAAVGAFYQPNANTMVNMGISLGNGDPGFNAGVSFKIGKGSTYNGVSKAEMAQTIHDQAAEISTIKANDAAKDKRIDALEKENQEMKKQIQEILARLNG